MTHPYHFLWICRFSACLSPSIPTRYYVNFRRSAVCPIRSFLVSLDLRFALPNGATRLHRSRYLSLSIPQETNRLTPGPDIMLLTKVVGVLDNHGRLGRWGFPDTILRIVSLLPSFSISIRFLITHILLIVDTEARNFFPSKKNSAKTKEKERKNVAVTILKPSASVTPDRGASVPKHVQPKPRFQ